MIMILTGILMLIGARMIYKGIHRSWNERNKAQWLKVPGKFNPLTKTMARPLSGEEKIAREFRRLERYL